MAQKDSRSSSRGLQGPHGRISPQKTNDTNSKTKNCRTKPYTRLDSLLTCRRENHAFLVSRWIKVEEVLFCSHRICHADSQRI